jgi:hypothetical protein
MNETSIIEKLGTFELDEFKFNHFIEKSIRKLGMPLSQHLRKIPNFDNCNAIEKVILIIQFDFSKLSGMSGNTTQKYPSAPFHIDPLKKVTSKSDNCGH